MPDENPRLRQVRIGFERLGQPEVHDLGGLVVRQQNVARLEIAVDDPQAMGIPDGAGQYRDHARRGPGCPGNSVQPSGEAASFDVFHLEVGQTLVLAEVVNLHDVGVPELGDGLGLRQEAGASSAPCLPGKAIFKAQRRLSRIWRAL